MNDLDPQMRQIIAAANKSKPGSQLRYAAAYANMWLAGERNRVQLLYIRSNLSHWRGKTAAKVREAFDKKLESRNGC